MATAMMADLARLFFMVAPFTILPVVAIDLFGPAPATSLAEITNRQLMITLVVPSIIAAFGQLAATHLVLRNELTPRDSLGAAAVAFPLYALAQFVMALPIGLGLLLLLVPGIWLFGRTLFLSGAVVLSEPAAPVQLIQRCWNLTAANSLPLTLFLLLGLFGMIGIGLMAEGAGAALDVVASFAGSPEVGRFLHALMPGIGNCFVTVGIGAAVAAAYRRLTR
jgi:hypothetical protein